MKRINILIFTIIILFITITVKAESFYEGEYLRGEYIDRIIDNKVYYLTMQYIKSNSGEIVYCIEPFSSIDRSVNYIEKDNIFSYHKLDDATKQRISLIAYFGYGYKDHKEEKWYAITQYMIWKTIAGDKIYFTDKLNGTKINKYENEIREIETLIDAYYYQDSFIRDYTLNYKESLVLPEIYDYKVLKSDFDINDDRISNVTDNGTIRLTKEYRNYNNDIIFYESDISQDLIKPGNIMGREYEINIEVNKGNIYLDIKDDDSVYTIESKFDVCYEIKNNKDVVEKVCSDRELTYKSLDLPYGEYTIIETKVGEGYVLDKQIYKVNLNTNSKKVILYNQLLKNDININKKYCRNDICDNEEDAIFNLLDKNKNIVKTLTTNELGFATYQVGYGSYELVQVSGKEGYTISDTEKILVNKDKEIKNLDLYNYYIEEDIIIPPHTGIDNIYSSFILLLCTLFTLKISKAY